MRERLERAARRVVVAAQHDWCRRCLSWRICGGCAAELVACRCQRTDVRGYCRRGGIRGWRAHPAAPITR